MRSYGVKYVVILLAIIVAFLVCSTPPGVARVQHGADDFPLLSLSNADLPGNPSGNHASEIGHLRVVASRPNVPIQTPVKSFGVRPTNQEHNSSRSCVEFSLTRAPLTPLSTLPGHSFTLLVTVKNWGSEDLPGSHVRLAFNPSLASVDSPHSYLPNEAISMDPIPEGDTLIFPLTWTVHETTPIGSAISVQAHFDLAFVLAANRAVRERTQDQSRDTVADQQGNQCDQAFDNEISKVTIEVRPPAAAYVSPNAVPTLWLSDPDPSPGQIVTVAGAIRNPGPYALTDDDLVMQFRQSREGEAEWLDIIPNSTKLLYGDGDGYQETFYETSLHHDEKDPDRIWTFASLSGRTTLTWAFDARVRDDISPGTFVYPSLCVGLRAGDLTDEWLKCHPETTVVRESLSTVEIGLWVDSTRASDNGPIVVNISVRNTSDVYIDAARLFVEMPVALRYVSDSGSLAFMGARGEWTISGSSAAKVHDDWLSSGLLLSSPPRSTNLVRFAATAVPKLRLGQRPFVTATLVRGDEELDVEAEWIPLLPQPNLSIDIVGRVNRDALSVQGVREPFIPPIILVSGTEASAMFDRDDVVFEPSSTWSLGAHGCSGHGGLCHVLGDVVEYRLTVRNGGTTAVEKPVLVFQRPNGTVLLSGSLTSRGMAEELQWQPQGLARDAGGIELPRLNPGMSVMLDVRFGVPHGANGVGGVRQHVLSAWVVDQTAEPMVHVEATGEVVDTDNIGDVVSKGVASGIESVWQRLSEPSFLVIEGLVVVLGLFVTRLMGSGMYRILVGFPLGAIGGVLGWTVSGDAFAVLAGYAAGQFGGGWIAWLFVPSWWVRLRWDRMSKSRAVMMLEANALVQWLAQRAGRFLRWRNGLDPSMGSSRLDREDR